MKLGLGILLGVGRPTVLGGDEKSDAGFLCSFSELSLQTNTTAGAGTERRDNDVDSRERVNQR